LEEIIVAKHIDGKRIWGKRTPFSLPIFYHLMSDEKKIKNTTTLLEMFNLRIIEINSIPYFDLFSK